MNWWFGHNVLGLFYTPLALASVYYFLPKVIGRPIQSYNLSLLGFWSLAFFYSQVGGHHLIGGPVPEWMKKLMTHCTRNITWAVMAWGSTRMALAP